MIGVEATHKHVWSAVLSTRLREEYHLDTQSTPIRDRNWPRVDEFQCRRVKDSEGFLAQVHQWLATTQKLGLKRP
jgi:hypothetical protein